MQGTLDANFNALTQEFKSLIEFCLRLEPAERPLVNQFKFAAWSKGPTATEEEVYEEMTRRFIQLKIIKE